jgi:signal transduction histidine kinase
MSRLPIRVRIMLGFALAMLLVLAAAATFVYLQQRADLTETIDEGLERRSDDVSLAFGRSGNDLAGADPGVLSDPEEAFVQILTPGGDRVDGTWQVPSSVLSPDEAREAFRGSVLVERRVPNIEGTARILAGPLDAEQRSRVVVVGVSLADRDETLSNLVRSFLIGIPIAVLVASAIGYQLAKVGLAPVEAMRIRAKRISLGRGEDRLPVSAANDEVRRLGETLNEMLARLEESFQRERRFVADASHELRTPLSVLKAELEAAIRIAGHDPEVRNSLVVALEETDHLAQLAEDLLLIARAADGRLPLKCEALDLHELLERTAQRFADRARGQGREIRIDTGAGGSVWVDRLRVQQALGNLVDNALRHGRGEIQISARAEPGWSEIEVSDQGDGVPASVAPRAFERFASGDAARASGGAGLGLAIVQAIAEAHGGTAMIVHTNSAGATVRLRFPAWGVAVSPD